ncbi:hypothetical protein ASPWEDRAFT_102326 [Aspergillus wentii DTO 134E9]|uniref:Rhodanese domain-containing protein n=1 Tax=Aspergillus wentii DTO 134E9 TaxID=1073089 RepID=A0A1L9RZA2_ASPWE|nr:uncharacterized protein ASPWEDRAFT_102326 [Aspergillus wentii DTO 134E9]KAI9932661.1 hypothetical protein MW887_008910 [Aspergillus wentii]OJJ40233.1 hypothetical protein ASPWEDRAFT_102326 [Aspergillus wentii DTO 134E9]
MQSEQPWHAAFPAPRSTSQTIRKEQLLQWMHEGRKDYVVIDLRRTDFEGGTIRGTLNLPAQTLYPSIPTLYQVLSGGGIKAVIWYCGSCNGRGPRAANWFTDYLESKNDSTMQSLILEGGIKGWVKGGEEYQGLMEGFDQAFW